MRISDWSSDVCSSDLGPFGADEAETDGEPFYLAHGHGDVRIARHRGEAARAAAGDLIAVDAVDQPGGRHGRADQGDDVIVFEQSVDAIGRSEEHTSELQSLMRISYAVFCLKKKNTNTSQED